MTMIPFGGFFMAGSTYKDEIAADDAHCAKWPQYYVGHTLTEEGMTTNDPLFRADQRASIEAKVSKYNNSFVLQGLAKVGTKLIVKALPGGREYAYYGGELRTIVLGGTVGCDPDLNDIASDDFVVSYCNLLGE